MAHYRDQILACDFFTVETLFMQTIYVLFFIELSIRRVYIAGCTTEPRSAWIVQEARQLTWQLEGRTPAVHFLIHDRDTKFTVAFNTVFRGQAVHVILTPFRAPNANAVAERWVRTVRQECLDKLLILNQAHLRRGLAEYQTYYNEARPHQGLAQRATCARGTNWTWPSTLSSRVRRHSARLLSCRSLGGLQSRCSFLVLRASYLGKLRCSSQRQWI
jgi:hypothetical protein